MALGRRVLLTVASGSLIYSGMVSALGMGDIRLHSALNQPLSAEIDLLDVGDLSADDVRVALASSGDFQRVGVERLAFLQDLSFTPVFDGRNSRIRVTSNKPVREPYLNFLVEITRAKSRLLREYTVLIDPLPSSPAAPATLAVAVARAVGDAPRATVPAAVQPMERPAAAEGKRHRVASGESLWSIAGRYAPVADKGAQAQLMRGIQALNPQAFVNGDPSRLKASAELLLPDTAVDPAPAVAAPAESVAAPAAPLAPQPAAAAEPEPAMPTAEDDQVAMLRRQLFEELATSREENQQLKQMLIEMQQQLESVTAQLDAQNGAQVSGAEPVAAVTPTADRPGDTAAETSVAELAASPSDAAMAVPSRWQDWTLPTGGALMSMLLAGLWFMRRRKPQDTPQAAAVPARGSLRVAPVAAGALAEMPRQPAQASVSETDVLEAADIYLTYGRREEALDVLQRGIERAPEQLDLRLRYLGLLAESGDVESYRGAADGFLQAGGSPFLLQQVLALHPALAAAVAPVEPAPAPLAFTLDEPSASVARRSEPPLAEPPTLADADAIAAEDSALWLDDFDEVLTLGELPTLLGQPDAPATPPAADALRQLEPNPQHLVRLNQAVAYIKQGDMDSACRILESLATEGDEQQRRQVSELLAQIA